MNLFEKTYPTIGCCGLDCGLCPRFYTVGTSRCPGCAGADFASKRPSCSFITCCFKRRGFEVCGQCPEFPCLKFKSDEFYQQIKEPSSYPSYKKVIPNLNFIKEHGIKKFLEQQKKRIELLETMINDFNDGRSKSFFCKAACLLDLNELENSINEGARKNKENNITDIALKTKNLKNILNDKLQKK